MDTMRGPIPSPTLYAHGVHSSLNVGMTPTMPDKSEPAQIWTSREAADAWHRLADRRVALWRSVSERMLDLASVGVGSRVLDVAAGTGDDALLAVRRVGPSGHVLATDLSAHMLEIAAELGRQAGVTNIETHLMDAERVDLPPDAFDAVICRNGLMFIPDLRTALLGLRRVLRPGGKIAAVVFSSEEKNPVVAIAQEIVRRIGRLPRHAPGEPGWFALGAPGVLEAAFRAAGFRDVAVEPISTTRRAASIQDVVHAMQDNPVLSEPLSHLGPAEREQASREMVEALRGFAGPDGFDAPGESLLAVGTK